MGYTHYWYRPKELDKDKFKAAVNDCRKICSVLPIPLGNWEGKDSPEFSNKCISFNGHINSLCLIGKAPVSIPWPTDDAKGIAVEGNGEPREGKWFAGDLLNSRCADEKGDGSYESFVIERIYPVKRQSWQATDPETGQKNRWFSCCKTAFRPYDLNVQCCLIAFKQHFGNIFEVASDGTTEQWNEARDICQHVLSYGLLFELNKDD